MLYGYNTHYLVNAKKYYTGIYETSCKSNYATSRNECRIYHASKVTRIVINDERKYSEPSNAVVLNNVKILRFQVRSQNCKRRLLASSCLSLCICLSVRMEQPAFHLMEFHEILYLRIFGKFVEKIVKTPGTGV